MFWWTLPFVSAFTIGNDYTKFPLQQQLELMFSVANGSFPLYAPGFSGGQTSAAATLGQLWHPLTHLAAMMPGYWQGLALDWITALRIVSLAATHAVLFTVLARLQLGSTLAFVLSLITVYNLRMLDLFRYGASLESWTGFLLLSASLIHLSSAHQSNRGRAGVAFATAWLVLSGHPQMAYIGLLGAAILGTLAPFVVRAIEQRARPTLAELARLWGAMALGVALGLGLAAMYALPFRQEFLAAAPVRASADFAWANSMLDTGAGLWNNWFMPLRSDVHGAFGGSSLVLLVLGAPIVLAARRQWDVSLIGLHAAIAVVFCVMFGGALPVYGWLWDHVPLMSVMRGPTRFSMVLAPMLMLALAWTLKAGDRATRAVCVMAVVALAAFVAAVLSGGQTISALSAEAVRAPQLSLQLAIAALGAFSLLLTAAMTWRPDAGSSPRWRPSVQAALVLCVVAQVALALSVGTWVERKQAVPDWSLMQTWKRAALDYRMSDSALEPALVRQHLARAHLEPALAQLHRRATAVTDVATMYARLENARRSPDLFIIGTSPANFETPPALDERARVSLSYASYNRLDFRIAHSEDVWLQVGIPWHEAWKAYAIDQTGTLAPVGLYRANGIAMAVPVRADVSRIQLRYESPAARNGMLITVTAMVGLGVWLSVGSARRWPAIVSVVAAATLYVVWHSSLYAGANLGTQFQWNQADRTPASNLAYGRPATASSQLYTTAPARYHPRRAVDGDHGGARYASTEPESGPSWQVALAKPARVHRIIVRGGMRVHGGDAVHAVSVAIAGTDGHWVDVATIRPPDGATVDLCPARETDGIQVRGHGFGQLVLREVEVYGELPDSLECARQRVGQSPD